MADDIVERLRKREMLAVIGRDRPDIYKDAADKIEQLRKDIKVAIMGDSAELKDAKKEIERLREALKPFAYYAEQIPNNVSNTASASGTVGDLRAAKAALEEK